MTTAAHWHVDDIDDALAADFDGSLSGLGMELGTSSFNMSEALLALPSLNSLKHESHHHIGNNNHFHQIPHQFSPRTHSEPPTTPPHTSSSNLGERNNSALLSLITQEDSRPVAVVHGKKNRLAYSNEDEAVTNAIKRFCLSNERESSLLNEVNRYLLTSNSFSREDEDHECGEGCTNDIRCQHRHSSSVPDLRTTAVSTITQSHSTASSPSSSCAPTPTSTSSILSQILTVQQQQQYVPATTPPPSTHEVPATNTKSNNNPNRFQYVLGAATSMAVKMHEETMTYLNQGQSYEIKLKKLGDLTEMRGKMLKSILRVGFQERRLQYMEKELISQWKQQRPSDRILEIDIPLSYGVHDIYNDKKNVNKCEFNWDPTKETGVFVRVNCISTEFTPKKHGGEKGVPFRLVIETYPHDGKITTPSSCLHAASCQVKVFKPKGADRKHKTDREKMSKRSQTEQEKFQQSYDCTVFTDCPLDSLFSFSSSSAPQTPVSKSALTKVEPKSVNRQEKPLLKPPSPQIADSNDVDDSESEPSNASMTSTFSFSQPLSSDASAVETAKWLNQNRFGSFTRTFSNFSGTDILRLSREDFIQICGLTDGIRLFNALHSRSLRPRLTVYICTQSDEVFRALYLENLTIFEITSKLSQALVATLGEASIRRICMIGPSGIRILVSDEVVRNISPESMFVVELCKDQGIESYQALLKPYKN